MTATDMAPPATGFDSRAVANWILDRAEVDRTPVDHMKLHKLVYLAHGWHLTRTGRPLIKDAIEAWPYGPVIPVLYREFKQFGDVPIDGRAFDFNFDIAENVVLREDFPADTLWILDLVWQSYGGYSGPELSRMTHEPGTPWEEVVRGKRRTEIRHIPLDNERLKRHFDRQRELILAGG
jgi:uncharacterized phage-associated protein